MRDVVVKGLCGLAIASALLQPSHAVDAGDLQAGDMHLASGLICDTPQQAERFVSLLGGSVESALGTVNREAGTPNACLVATFAYRAGQTVLETQRNGTIVNVVEVLVTAVATAGGMQVIQPTTYYSVVNTGDRIA